MSIEKEITLKLNEPHPTWCINTIDGLTIRNMVMLKRFMNRFNSSYIEPSDEDLYEYIPLLMHGTEAIPLLEIRKAVKRNIFCKMCIQISICPRIPLIKVIEFYNSNLSRKETD